MLPVSVKTKRPALSFPVTSFFSLWERKPKPSIKLFCFICWADKTIMHKQEVLEKRICLKRSKSIFGPLHHRLDQIQWNQQEITLIMRERHAWIRKKTGERN